MKQEKHKDFLCFWKIAEKQKKTLLEVEKKHVFHNS